MATVILEGPDNSGKTTFAKRLCEVSGAKYYHPGGAPADAQVEQQFLLEQQLKADRGGPVVMDRVTSVSQQVYNPDAERDADRFRHLQLLLRGQFVFLVYCRPSNEHLSNTSNFTWRPEEAEEHRQKIITRSFEWVQRYDDLMARVPCLHYDFQDTAAAEVLQTALIGALTEDSLWMEWLSAMIFKGRRA